MINIFVTDDHPIVREGLIAVLETQFDFKIVGEANNGKEAIEKLQQIKADILILDLGMPIMDGVEVIQRLKKQKNPIKIIVFTVFDTDERIMSAIRAGAKGYLLKGAGRKEIFNAIRTVYDGGSLLQPIVAAKVFQHLSGDIEKLTPRELEVIQLIGKGLKNAAIGQKLFISERTVKFHVSSILSKLQAKNRTEAVQIAIKKGFITL